MQTIGGIDPLTKLACAAVAIMGIGGLAVIFSRHWFIERQLKNSRIFNKEAHPVALHGSTGRFCLELLRWSLHPNRLVKLLRLRWRHRSLNACHSPKL
jgi:hypothetical protein